MNVNSWSHKTTKNIPLDYILDEIFNKKTHGFFIELGANDGLTQSNTAFFEFLRNWRGILIEPSLKGYELCKINRPSSICVNYACVSDDYKYHTIKGNFIYNSLMGSVNGERQKDINLNEVEALTLEKILDDNIEVTQDIDFLSLDVEGYELNVLKGLNLNKYKPKYILIEIHPNEFGSICSLLESHNYILIGNISNYNKVDNPGWDGTHNDYLFKIKD